ncbi:MAG: FHA domain-containing protein, partial [Planctomycetes bacterium]|nr:FHA domain-containing protein [Planctomycetota bacterium]
MTDINQERPDFRHLRLTIVSDLVQNRRQFAIGAEPARLGRLPSMEIHLETNMVSRSHARVVMRGKQYYLEDTGSRGGTLLNGTRIIASAELHDG